MTEYRVFASGTPGLPNETDGPIAVSTGFVINDANTYWVTGIEFYAASSAPTGVEVALWVRNADESFGATPGALLASKVAGTINAGVRNQVLFDTPVEVSAAVYSTGLYATMYTANRYVATAGYFSSADDTSGPIRAYQAGTVGTNGRFKVTATGAADSYPNTQFGGNGYWVTPIVTDVDPNAGDTLEADGNRSGTGTITGAATRVAVATGDRTGTGSITGAASGSFGVTGDRTGVGAISGAATVISDLPAEPTTNSAGWYGYLNIMRNNAEETRRQLNEPPTACPDCGEPLDVSVHGVRFCPFDGWEWNGVAAFS